MQLASSRAVSRRRVPSVRAASATADVVGWLVPQHVVLEAEIHDREHAIDLAGNTLATALLRDRGPVLRALWRRELAASTALGHGVAVPHARIHGLTQPATLFVRARRAIPFEAPDGKPVGMFFVILVPPHGNPEDHLRLLSHLAELFLDSRIRVQLLGVDSEIGARQVFAQGAQRFA
jgi:PTS system nitrogen regulatory IIA component